MVSKLAAPRMCEDHRWEAAGGRRRCVVVCGLSRRTAAHSSAGLDAKTWSKPGIYRATMSPERLFCWTVLCLCLGGKSHTLSTIILIFILTELSKHVSSASKNLPAVYTTSTNLTPLPLTTPGFMFSSPPPFFFFPAHMDF